MPCVLSTEDSYLSIWSIVVLSCNAVCLSTEDSTEPYMYMLNQGLLKAMHTMGISVLMYSSILKGYKEIFGRILFV